jgi:hypothetical protein
VPSTIYWITAICYFFSRYWVNKWPGSFSVCIYNARWKACSAVCAQSYTACLSPTFVFIICFMIINEVIHRGNSVNNFTCLGFFKDAK